MGLGHLFKHIGHGIAGGFKAIGHGLQGAVHVLGSAARLDFKGIAAGASEITGAVTELAKDVVLISPIGLAANTLLDDKLEKVLNKLKDVSDHATQAVFNGVAAGATGLKDGLVATVHGVVTGDVKEVFSGVVGAAVGGLSLLPSAIVVNAAASAVGSVVGDVIPGKIGNVLGTVASSVVGVSHVAEGVLTAGATALSSSGALSGLQGVIPDQLALATPLAGGALVMGSMVGGSEPAGPTSGHTSPDRPSGGPQTFNSHASSHGPGKKPGAAPPSPQSTPEFRTDSQAQRPNKIELANASRQEAAELLNKNLTADQINDLNKDVRDYFKHGTDDKRQELKAKWGDQIGGDFNDSGLYKKLLFAVKDLG